jgi:hypothetical protein
MNYIWYLQEKIAMRWWFSVSQLVTLPAPEASAHIQDGTLALEKRHSKGLALRWNLPTQHNHSEYNAFMSKFV